MKEEHLDAVDDYVFERITLQQFLERYPVDPRQEKEHVCDLLRNAIATRNEQEVEAAELLGFKFGFTPSCLPLLNALLVEDWHINHEDIARALQEMKDPSSIEALYQAAQMQFSYLDYDEAFALAVKCCWALGDINTDDADAKLRELTKLDNPIKAGAAREQLERRDRPVRTAP